QVLAGVVEVHDLGSLGNLAVAMLWVPKTCVAWADALQIAVGPGPRSGAGRAGLGPSAGAMIFGLWA
ncbi:MAG: hypothetical protein ACRDOA_15920, partial [Streptosporangiaceae bacterium]